MTLYKERNDIHKYTHQETKNFNDAKRYVELTL